MTVQGKPALTLAVVIGAVVILAALVIVAWGAGKQYRDLQDTLRKTQATLQKQSADIASLRSDLKAVRLDLAGIRAIAAKARTKIIKYRTEVAHANDSVDSLPDPDVQPALRAVADAYIAEHATAPAPAHGDPDR